MLRQWLNEDRIADPKKMVFDENLYNWLPSLSTLLSDYERLEKEAEAGRKLFALYSKLTPDKVDEAERAFEKIVVEAKAGRVLAEAIGKINLPDDDGRKDLVPEKIQQRYDKSPLAIFNYGLNEANKYWREHRDQALATYNSAVEKI